MVKIASALQGAVISQDVGPAYASSRLGQRFAVAHATPGTGILSPSTAYDDEKPTFLFQQTGKDKRVILSRMYLVQTGTVAGGPISIAVIIDSVIRRASAGTLVTPKATNMAAAGAAGVSFYTLPTAVATTVTERVVAQSAAAKLVGTVTDIDFGDGIMIDGTGSILVYAWAGTTAPTWTFFFEIIEETL